MYKRQGCKECTLCASYDVDLSKIEERKQEIFKENETVIKSYRNQEAKKELDFLNALKEETLPKRNKTILIDKYNKAIKDHENYIEVDVYKRQIIAFSPLIVNNNMLFCIFFCYLNVIVCINFEIL